MNRHTVGCVYRPRLLVTQHGPNCRALNTNYGIKSQTKTHTHLLVYTTLSSTPSACDRYSGLVGSLAGWLYSARNQDLPFLTYPCVYGGCKGKRLSIAITLNIKTPTQLACIQHTQVFIHFLVVHNKRCCVFYLRYGNTRYLYVIRLTWQHLIFMYFGYLCIKT